MFAPWKLGTVLSLLLIVWACTSLAQNAARRCSERCPPCESARGAEWPNDAAAVSPEQIAARRREGAQLRLAVELERNRTTALLIDARRARDLPRYQCLFDRLTQLDWLVNAAGEGLRALDDAIAVGDHRQGEHALRWLRIDRQRASVLAAESSRCITVDRRTVVNETVVAVSVPAAVANVED